MPCTGMFINASNTFVFQVLCIPFSYIKATENPNFVSDQWQGNLESKYGGLWADLAIAMVCAI